MLARVDYWLIVYICEKNVVFEAFAMNRRDCVHLLAIVQNLLELLTCYYCNHEDNTRNLLKIAAFYVLPSFVQDCAGI